MPVLNEDIMQYLTFWANIKKGDGSRDAFMYNSENCGGLTVQKACDLLGDFGKAKLSQG